MKRNRCETLDKLVRIHQQRWKPGSLLLQPELEESTLALQAYAGVHAYAPRNPSTIPSPSPSQQSAPVLYESARPVVRSKRTLEVIPNENFGALTIP
jgi:hypothetical protein